MSRHLVLATRRTRITRWLPSDLADLAELHADPVVMTHLGKGRPETLDEVRARLDDYLREQQELGWTKWRVEDLSGRMIGRAGFGPYGEGRELGYTLARRVWGRGLATEIADALVHWHRAHPRGGQGALTAFAATSNAASRRVLEKVGFRFQRIQPHDGRPHALYELAP